MPTDSFRVQVNDRPVLEALGGLLDRLQDMTPAMRHIAEGLRTEVEENFLREGRPEWLALAPSTVAARVKAGGGAHPILQVTGGLAASVELFYSATEAGVGTNKVYGAIHQFGGQAGRGRRTTIPARPFLPVNAAGELQPEAARSVLDAIQDFLDLEG